MELFSHAAKKEKRGEPLAERMRPRTIEEVVGQRHLLAAGKLLERALATGNLPSLILWGPPARKLNGSIAARSLLQTISAWPRKIEGNPRLIERRMLASGIARGKSGRPEQIRWYSFNLAQTPIRFGP